MAPTTQKSQCPSEADLLLFVTGERPTDPEVFTSHVFTCPICSGRIKDHQILQGKLKEVFSPAKQLLPNSPGAVDKILARIPPLPASGTVPASTGASAGKMIPILFASLLVVLFVVVWRAVFPGNPGKMPNQLPTQIAAGPALPPGAVRIDLNGKKVSEVLLQGESLEVSGRWYLLPGSSHLFSSQASGRLILPRGSELAFQGAATLQLYETGISLKSGRFRLTARPGESAAIGTDHIQQVVASGSTDLEVAHPGTQIRVLSGWCRLDHAGRKYHLGTNQRALLDGKSPPPSLEENHAPGEIPMSTTPTPPFDPRRSGGDSRESAPSVIDR
jgi:hypothetical protein